MIFTVYTVTSILFKCKLHSRPYHREKNSVVNLHIIARDLWSNLVKMYTQHYSYIGGSVVQK